MNSPGCVVIERPSEWFIIVGEESERLALDVEATELAVCADLMSKLADLSQPRCVLVPGSSSCFFQSLLFSSADDVDTRDRAALTYELEDHLPIDAESMVADFVVVPSNPGETRISAVALQIERWRQLIDALESQGILVTSVVPRAVLASRAASNLLDNTDSRELLLVDAMHCDSMRFNQGRLIAWKHLMVEPSQLERHRLLDGGVNDDSDAEDDVFVIGATNAQRALFSEIYPEAQFLEVDVDALTLDAAAALLTKPSQQAYDFRRDALAPSDRLRAIQPQIRLAALAAAVCLIAAVAGGWWRANRIQQEIASVTAQQKKQFRDAFPDSKVPAALLRRVRSEHTKVLGSLGETTEVDLPQSAPFVLRKLLGALPRDVRFRVTTIKIANGRVNLDLQVRSPVDAGTLATSLSAAGFDVKPPGTTQKDAKTFESLLEAEWIGQPTEDFPASEDVSVHLKIKEGRTDESSG